MGTKTWMLVYSNGNASEALQSRPELNREATAVLAKKLFSSEKLEPINDGTLLFTGPADNELVVGCFPGLSIVAAREFCVDYPSRLAAAFLDPALGQTTYLCAMHSVVDWFAYAVWKNGQLQRALSLSPDNGVLEDIGPRLPFEEPFWAGQRPSVDAPSDDSDYPFAFHPLELGDAALLALLGYQFEGEMDLSQVQPEDITLMRFKRSKSWWKFR